MNRAPGVSAHLGPDGAARLAVADAAEVFPGVEAGLVAVVPLELEGVLADGRDLDGPGRRFVHDEEGLRLRLGLPGFPASSLAFFMAGGAGAGIAQPAEGP